MPLYLSVILLLLAVLGILLSHRLGKTARTVCTVACVLLALACVVYIGLTLLFVDAIQHQPPSASLSL